MTYECLDRLITDPDKWIADMEQAARAYASVEGEQAYDPYLIGQLKQTIRNLCNGKTVTTKVATDPNERTSDMDCEMYVVLSADGDFGVGKDEDEARGNHPSDLNEADGGFRVFKLILDLPLPKVVEVSGKVEDGQAVPITLNVEEVS